MKELLIVLLLMSFAVNKEIRCKPNEVLDEQTQKCEKKCEEGKVFDSKTLSCELNSTNTTGPEGQIFNNQTSSCEDKKVDPTTKNGDANRQDGDGTTKDDAATTKDNDATRQDDDPHELIYDIKSKETKRTLRKLSDVEVTIFINGRIGTSAKYLSDQFFSNYPPNKVYLNYEEDISYHQSNSITLNRDGENTIEVGWQNEIISCEYMFNECSSIVSLDLSSLNTNDVKNMNNMFSGCSSLQSLDFSNFGTNSAENMQNMFSGCSSLKSLDLSSFFTYDVVNMQNMFSNCTLLESLKLDFSQNN